MEKDCKKREETRNIAIMEGNFLSGKVSKNQKAACDRPGATAGNRRRLAFRFPAEGFPFRPLQVRICRRALELRAPPGSRGTLHHLLEQKLTQQTSIPGLLSSSPEASRSLQEGSFHSVKSSEDLALVLLFEPSPPFARSSLCVGGAKPNNKTVRFFLLAEKRKWPPLCSFHLPLSHGDW